LKNILSIIILSIITIITFTLLTLKGGFPLVRADVIEGSATGEDGVAQEVSIIAFNGFHVLNIVYSSLIAIFIGLVSNFGLKEIYAAILKDVANRRKD